MANIRSLLKNATQVLFSDHDHFNKDITGVKNIKEVKSVMGIYCNMKKVGTFGNKVLYQAGDYNFTLTIIS
ncbi:phosphoribosylpyrophosphate synthetase [Escherichia phage Av-05]|uniref:Phosphoribosylpyrophosphate synthetase n=1 Tax=Escherichia phage Av-05 TaxID=1527519 RepID=A0A076G6G9_9CAUD|nr:phosphoribosylpyrophosphate synthetase [Escherichia phage Av-05]AII27570.1 phosphoribosylpyrophosphate synthetase [Escherichia phage Av-05]